MNAVTNTILLGVNVDHVATIRQARLTRYPDPVHAALLAERAGADGITIHLREDRRHIQNDDVYRMKKSLTTRMNLEMAVTTEMVAFAEEIKPEHVCLVPEKREKLTTEGGLDVLNNEAHIQSACEQLAVSDIQVSLFIDPDKKQIEAAKRVGAPVIELHTGCYADARSDIEQTSEYHRIVDAVTFADELGLIVNAGHGLHYENVEAIAQIPQINELNIGHAIVAQAMYSGMSAAVQEMKTLILKARE